MDIIEHSPSAQAFSALREKIGWGTTDLKLVQRSLEDSLYHVCVYENEQLIGMGRVVGDMAMYFYIQDVVVDPDFQQQGIGTMPMNAIEGYLEQVAVKGSTVGLLAAQGKEGFYEGFGYSQRTGLPLGLGMCKFI